MLASPDHAGGVIDFYGRMMLDRASPAKGGRGGRNSPSVPALPGARRCRRLGRR